MRVSRLQGNPNPRQIWSRVAFRSNAAGSMNMKHLVLLQHFGVRYPVSEAEGNAFLDGTSRSALSKIFLDAMQGAARRNGIDWNQLRQGAFFTREGKTLIPGTNSASTAGELMKYIVQMEKGDLVARFQDGLFQVPDAVLLSIEDGQQRLDERCAFGFRNRGQLKLHTFHIRKTNPDQLRLNPGLLRSYAFRVQLLHDTGLMPAHGCTTPCPPTNLRRWLRRAGAKNRTSG